MGLSEDRYSPGLLSAMSSVRLSSPKPSRMELAEGLSVIERQQFKALNIGAAFCFDEILGPELALKTMTIRKALSRKDNVKCQGMTPGRGL